MASYAEGRRLVEMFSSDGRAAADDRTRVRLGVQVVARRNGRVETGHETLGGQPGFELLEDDPEPVAEKAARQALTPWTRSTRRAAGCPSSSATLRRRPAARGGRARARGRRRPEARQRLRRPARREARRPFVTAYDDGRRANEWGSDGIDDEGTPTQRTTIIEDGRLASYLYDRYRARKDGVESTGNGRRESFRHLPVPRMTNTYFAPGEATEDELIGESSAGFTRSRSAAARSSPPPATSCSASPRRT